MTTKHGPYQFINSRRREKKIVEQCFFYMCACYKHKNDNGNCLKAHVKCPSFNTFELATFSMFIVYFAPARVYSSTIVGSGNGSGGFCTNGIEVALK